MKPEKCFLYCIIFIFTSYSFTSCDLITEPERFIDKNVAAPSIGYLYFENLSEGQHVDGVLRIQIDTTNIDFEVTAVSLFIDGQEIYRYQNKPFTIILDTRNYSEGLHQIGIGVRQDEPNHGLLNLLFVPTVYLETELFFDRTEPASINITTSDDEAGFTIINWSQSPNLNFVAYKILRSYNSSLWDTIATIFSKEVTSFKDSVDYVINGLEVDYKLIHYTAFDFSLFKESEVVTHFVGHMLNYDIQMSSSKRGLVSNPILNQIYFMLDGKILSFSTDNNLFQRELYIPDLPNGYPFASFAVSNDGLRIFVYKNYERKLWILGTGTNLLYLIGTRTLNVPEELRTDSDEIFHIEENKILLFGRYEKVRLIDINLNVVLDSLIALPNVDITSIAVSADRTKLVTALRDRNNLPNNYKIQLRDLNSAGMPVINEATISEYCAKIMISANDQKIIELPVQSTKINIRDINTLSITGIINSEQNKLISDFTLRNNEVFSIQPYSIIFNGNPKSVHKITGYDFNSLQGDQNRFLTNVWNYNLDINGNFLYLPSSISEPNVVGFATKLE